MSVSMRKIGNDTEEDRMLNELFVSPIRAGFLEIGEDKYVIPTLYEGMREKLDNVEVHNDDVWVTGYPKTGTTWLHKIVHAIVKNQDFESSELHLDIRTFFLDYSIVHDENKIIADFGYEDTSFELIAEQNRPRLIKTHLHWSLLPEQIKNGTKKPKIIHILRNPKDTCVSYYKNSQTMDGYIGDFEQFCRLFLAGRLNYGPFFATPLSYWRERARPNILFVHYKDMKKDLPGSIKTILEFLGKSYTEDEINSLAARMTFDAMKDAADKEMNVVKENFFKFYNLTRVENKFFRAGKEGGYKSEMSPELIEKFDAWAKKNLAGTELSFE